MSSLRVAVVEENTLEEAGSEERRIHHKKGCWLVLWLRTQGADKTNSKRRPWTINTNASPFPTASASFKMG